MKNIFVSLHVFHWIFPFQTLLRILKNVEISMNLKNNSFIGISTRVEIASLSPSSQLGSKHKLLELRKHRHFYTAFVPRPSKESIKISC